MPYPSAESTMVAWAKHTTAVASLCNSRIAKQLPEKPDLPFLVCRRVSGAPDASEVPVLDMAMVQFSAYAAKYKSGTKAKPDWGAAEAIALEIMNQADLVSNVEVALPDGTTAQIDGMDILSMGEVQEEDTGWAHYQITVMATIRFV